jgi:7,8-dihydropterin-6-yl-methyl-4-(beta-D-ribofuranosyl)aminobenzene 5'-phosphate synthase
MIELKPIDRVEILSVMDNSIDVLMSSTPVAKRAKRDRDALSKAQLRAEHGVSMLVTTYEGGSKDSFLFDTGVTVDGVLHNMDVLEVKGNELHAVVLSHGHTDHTRGLMGFYPTLRPAPGADCAPSGRLPQAQERSARRP